MSPPLVHSPRSIPHDADVSRVVVQRDDNLDSSVSGTQQQPPQASPTLPLRPNSPSPNDSLTALQATVQQHLAEEQAMHRRMIEESLEMQTFRHRLDQANTWRDWEIHENQLWQGRVQQEMNNATANYEAECAAVIISNQKLDTASRKYAEMTAQSISVNQDFQNLRRAHLQETQLVQRLRQHKSAITTFLNPLSMKKVALQLRLRHFDVLILLLTPTSTIDGVRNTMSSFADPKKKFMNSVLFLLVPSFLTFPT